MRKGVREDEAIEDGLEAARRDSREKALDSVEAIFSGRFSTESLLSL